MSGRSYWSLTANKHAHFRAFVQEGDPGHVGDLCLCGGQAGTPEHLELLLCEAKWTQLVKCSLQAAFRASRRNWALPQLSSSALFWRSLPHFWSSDWIYKFPTDYRRGLRSLDQREISTLQHTTVGTVFRRTPGREYNRGKWNLLKGKQRLKISVNQSAKITVWWHVIEQQKNREITCQIAWEKFYLDADKTASLPPADISAKLCPSEDSRVKDLTGAPEGTTWKIFSGLSSSHLTPSTEQRCLSQSTDTDRAPSVLSGERHLQNTLGLELGCHSSPRSLNSFLWHRCERFPAEIPKLARLQQSH